MLVALLVTARLMIHTPNFQPMMAASLLAGFLFRSRLVALVVVGLAMAVTDLALGGYEWALMATVYLAVLLPVGAGHFLRDRLSRESAPLALTGNAVLASIGFAVLFFLLTNAAVWLWTPWYSHDSAGLVTCMAAGLVFFKWTLLSNIVFTALMFFAWECAAGRVGNRSHQRAPAAIPVRRF